MALTFRKRSILPGFGLALGYTIFYLCLIVLIPLAATFLKASSLSWSQFWHIASGPRALASYRLTFGASLIGAVYQFVFWCAGRVGVGAVQVSGKSGYLIPWWTCRSRCLQPWRELL